MENFDLMAKEFDTVKRIERAKIIADEIRLHINDGYKKSAIEYGCGTGLVGLQLINDFDTIFFVDSSAGMIEQVKRKLISLNKTVNHAICCDFIMEIPHDLRVDYIFSSLTLHHIKDTESIILSFYNMLHNAGHLLIVDLDTDDGGFHAEHPDYDGHNGFEQSDLIDIANKVGFTKVKANSFYYGSKIVNGKEAPYSLFILKAEKYSE